ncbi:MAG: PUA domain-containing protein [Nanobdellota archaeon]
MVRKQFSKKDIKEFISNHSFAENILTKKSSVFVEGDCLYVDSLLSFIYIDDAWIPSLKLLQTRPLLLPRVVVDKGAIKFIVNGADVMRPGIVGSDSFSKDSIIAVVDETMHKPIAVCRTLFDSNTLMAISSGKVLKTLHHISDSFWSS